MASTTAQGAPRLSFQVAHPHASGSAPALTPPAEAAERTQWLDIATAPASARTSFTRVDQTRAGTPSEDEASPTDAHASAVPAPAVGSHAAAASEPEGAHHAEEPTATEPVPQTPQAALTFLLVSGRRRTMTFEPETPVGRVKELVWNTWPSDWQDERPPAPAYLRLLYLGRVLQDDDTLSKLNIPSASPPPPPTIMHLSVRPSLPGGEDDALKKKKSGRRRAATSESEADANAGCCAGCVIF